MKPLILIGLLLFGGAYWFGVRASELSRQTYPWFFDKNVEQPVRFNGDGFTQKELEASCEMKRLDGHFAECGVAGLICLMFAGALHLWKRLNRQSPGSDATEPETNSVENQPC